MISTVMRNQAGHALVFDVPPQNVANIQQSKYYAIDLVSECAIWGDAEFVDRTVAGLHPFISDGYVAHHIQHPSLKFWKIEIKGQVRKSLANVVVAEAEHALRLWGKPANVQVFSQHDHRNRGAVEQIGQVAAELCKLLVAALDFFVHRV